MTFKNKKKTLSASVDPEIIRRLRSVANESGVSQSAIISNALRLYTSLPRASRRTFEDRVRSEGAPFQERLLRELQRLLLRSKWEDLAERIDRDVGDLLSAEPTEEDLLGVATDAIEESRRERGR